MKRFLLLIIVILIALLFILNWKQRKQISSCAKAKKQEVECMAIDKYQEGKQWVEKKVDAFK